MLTLFICFCSFLKWINISPESFWIYWADFNVLLSEITEDKIDECCCFFSPTERRGWKSALEITDMSRIHTVTSLSCPWGQSWREVRGQCLIPLSFSISHTWQVTPGHPQGAALFPILTIKLLITPSSMLVAIRRAICIWNSFLSQAVFSHEA